MKLRSVTPDAVQAMNMTVKIVNVNDKPIFDPGMAGGPRTPLTQSHHPAGIPITPKIPISGMMMTIGTPEESGVIKKFHSINYHSAPS